MKANELRIGNLVFLFKGISDSGAEWKEYSIDDGFDLYKIDENDCSDIEPIPITEEWLERFGFEVSYRSNFTLRLDHIQDARFGAGWNLVNNSFHVRFIGERFSNIKYVHQLQNLYFSITGQEIELK